MAKQQRIITTVSRAAKIQEYTEQIIIHAELYKNPIPLHPVGRNLYRGQGRDGDSFSFRCVWCEETHWVAPTWKAECTIPRNLSKLQRTSLYGILAGFKLEDRT